VEKAVGITTMFHEVIQEHYPSDHTPLLAKLEFKL